MKEIIFCTVWLYSLNLCESKLFLDGYNKPQFVHPLETLTFSLFSSETLCVWTDSNMSNGVENILNRVFQFHKAVININYRTANISAKTCIDNVVFNTISTFFNDRPPSVTNVFLVVDTEINFSSSVMYKQDELIIFGSAKVILLQKNQMFKLSSPYFPPRRFRRRYSLSTLEDETTLNLRGRKVNVISFNCSLFSMMKDSFRLHDGIEMRMLKELAYRVNFTPNFVEVSGVGKWGIMLPNGSWVGGVAGALESGDAELGFCNVWNVLRYANSFDFGPPSNMVYHTYMVPRPRMVQGFWIIIIQLFKKHVWILLLVTFLLVTFLYWKFKEPYSNALMGKSDVVQSVLTVYGIFIATSSHLPPSTVRFARQVITSWSVFSFFICSIFCNTVISRLMIPHLSSLIDSVEDIVRHNYLWGEPGYTNDSKRSIYFNLDDPWQARLESNYRHLTNNTSRAALHSGKFVFPVQRLGEEYIFVNIDGLETMDFKGFRVISQNLNQFYSSFGFSRHSPLLEVCRKPLTMFMESGLTQYWRRDVILQHGKKLVKFLLSESATESVDSFKPLTFSSNLAAFRILISGWAMASLCFAFELVIKHKFQWLKKKLMEKRV